MASTNTTYVYGNDIVDLRSQDVTSVPDGAAAFVLTGSYNGSTVATFKQTVGLGGGGVYRLIKSGMGTGTNFPDTGYNVVTPSAPSGTGARWHRISIGLHSVKDFGAKGDGASSNDDTTAIRNAIAAVGPGGTLCFPAGTYLVRGLITNDAAALEINQANQSWVLDPGALIKLDSIPESKSANVVRTTAAGVSITGRGTIQGAVPPLGSEPQDYNQAIVQVAGVTGVTIEDIRIVGNRSARAVSASMPSYSHDGVFASSGSDGLRVREINVKTVGGRGIRVFNCDDVALDANSFLNPYADAINCNVGPTASHSLRVSDNYIDKTGVPQPVAGLIDDGIKVVGQINTVDPAQSKLYESIIVTGNTVRLPPTFLRMLSIEIFGGARHVSTVANSTSGGNMGISYNNVQFGSVTGNVVKSPQYRGIELADVFDTTASGNSLFGGAFGQEGIGCSATNVAAEFHQNKNLVSTGNSIAVFTETGILYAGVMHGVIGCNGIDMSTSTASAAPNAYGVWCKISSSNSIYNIPTDNVTICGNVVIGSGTGSGRNNFKVGFFVTLQPFATIVDLRPNRELA